MAEGTQNKWLVGCGIGCLVLIVLGILAGIGGYYAISQGMGEAAKALADQIDTRYQEAKEAGAIPEEHQALTDKLVQHAKSEDATMWGVILVASPMLEALEDNELTEEEVEDLQTVSDFLDEHPSVGLGDFTQFAEQHPEMGQQMQDLGQQIQQGAGQQ